MTIFDFIIGTFFGLLIVAIYLICSILKKILNMLEELLKEK
jgi:hypothetical protein